MHSRSASLWAIVVLGCGSRSSQQPQLAPSTHIEEPPRIQELGGDDADATWHRERPAPQKPGGAASCKSEDFGPAIVSDADYTTRGGVGAQRFSELRTSKAEPLEECGLESVLQRLASLTCDDGQNPFQGDLRAAHASRKGSYGPGGRCDKIIDLYEVRCSNGTFQVYADMYICSEATAADWL